MNKRQNCFSAQSFAAAQFRGSDLSICSTTTTTEPPTTTPPMRCEDPSIDIKASGKDAKFPKIQYISDEIEIEAVVLLDCPESIVEYKWTLSDNVTVEEISVDSDLEHLLLKPFTFPLGLVVICLEVAPETALDFYPQTDCRFFDVRAPELVALIKDDDVSSWFINEVLMLDASSSYDPLAEVDLPEGLRPQFLEYSWTCAKDVSRPIPSGYAVEEGEKRGEVSRLCADEEHEIIPQCIGKALCHVNPMELQLPINVWFLFQVSCSFCTDCQIFETIV